MRFSIPLIFRQAPAVQPTPDPAASAPAVQRDVGEVTERFGVPVTYMRSTVPEIESAFGYGHLDGRRGVNPANFRAFIAHTVEGEAIERLMGELEASECEARDAAASLRAQRAELAARTAEMVALREHREHATQEVARADEAVREAAAASEGLWHSGSLSHAAIFLGAGAMFIFGDVVMSQRIVADALSLTGHAIFGLLDESWVFALGLAMISIVLKPAYDRLVEKPYWEKKERRFVFTICALGVLSLVTLLVLGAFRFQSHGIQSQVQELTVSGPGSTSGSAAKLSDLSKQLNESELARWSFILSGILFAAAGAASLGIGLRYLRFHRHVRRPAARRLKEQEAARAQAIATRERVSAELAARTVEMERLITLVADRPSATELESQAAALAAERRELAVRFTAERSLRLTSLYDDGYELGRVVAADEAGSEEPERPRRKRPRPFVALRRAIREQTITPRTLN